MLLACTFDSEKKAEDKILTIQILLKNGANPNVRNKHTGFTPIHWLARYGNTESITLLLKKGAIEYIPDKKGFRPIDYAGKFNH